MAGVKTAAADALPLGLLPEMRYPDVHIESGWRPPPRRLASSAACRYTIRAQLRADTLSIDHSAFRVAEAPSAPRFATSRRRPGTKRGAATIVISAQRQLDVCPDEIRGYPSGIVVVLTGGRGASHDLSDLRPIVSGPVAGRLCIRSPQRVRDLIRIVLANVIADIPHTGLLAERERTVRHAPTRATTWARNHAGPGCRREHPLRRLCRIAGCAVRTDGNRIRGILLRIADRSARWAIQQPDPVIELPSISLVTQGIKRAYIVRIMDRIHAVRYQIWARRRREVRACPLLRPGMLGAIIHQGR